jgi:hypothetical protein
MDLLETSILGDIKRRMNDTCSKQQTHFTFTKGVKLQNCHHHIPWWRERYDMLTHYLGTYLWQTCNAPTGSKTMDALWMKNNTWMELFEVFHLNLNNPWSTHLLDTLMDKWRWNPYLFKNSCMFFKGPSQIHHQHGKWTWISPHLIWMQPSFKLHMKLHMTELNTHRKGGARTCGGVLNRCYKDLVGHKDAPSCSPWITC